ncbi:ArnT family glycosyltransferase [Plantactinospora siamensis]|uniref:ArnT family glycosyltransferase n=1 Tax=Plantactinospora siamensis TaxID=555372 RepID=A0ABV6NVB0_9ACTN
MSTPTAVRAEHSGRPAPARLRRLLPTRAGRLLRGRPTDPAWARPALMVLLAATAVLYLWNLTGRGWANTYYAGAVLSATQDWKAFFFGSVDAANFITVDKPPASLWLMALSGRVLGFSEFSMLLPQALAGVASVALLYATVRRWHGPAAGLLAGAALAVTPVAVLMFHYNNPDALLVLLLVLAAYATVRAVEEGDVRWLMLAGGALGFGFLTKMLQAFLVLPALALVYLVAAPTDWRRRVGHLLAGAAALLVTAGWWVAAVELWPASRRPYVGGSTDNSVLGLTFGYNGLGRILGGDGNPGGNGSPGGVQPPAGLDLPPGMELPAGGMGGFGGGTGVTRLFNDALGGQVSWLLPAALIALVAGLALTLRAPRTDRLRASLLLWGGWLLVTAAVFSFMSGIFHEYYTVALAPAIAALVGIGAHELWARRSGVPGRLGLLAMVVATGAWGFVLLNRTPQWYPALRAVLVVVSVVAAVALLIPGRRRPRVAVVGAVAALVTGLLGSVAYALPTASSGVGGPIPTAGPATGRAGGRPGGLRLPPGTELPAGMPALPGGGPAGMPGLGGAVDEQIAGLLRDTDTTWAAATVTTSEAAGLQLAAGRPVMGIGGFSGSDPTPTLADFQRYVAERKVRWFVASRGIGGGPGGRPPFAGADSPGGAAPGGGVPGAGPYPGAAGPMGGAGAAAEITRWVQDTFPATTVGGQTVYDLTKEKN